MTGADIESVDFQQGDLSNANLTEAEVMLRKCWALLLSILGQRFDSVT